MERTGPNRVLLPTWSHTLLHPSEVICDLIRHLQPLDFDRVSRYPDLLIVDSQNDINLELSGPFLDFRSDGDLEVARVIR